MALSQSGQTGPDRSQGKEIWLVYGTRHETDIYYHAEFEALAARMPNFHYLPTLSRAAGELDRTARPRPGARDPHHRGARRAAWPVASRAAGRSQPARLRAELRHLHLHLRPELMVSGVRELLTGFGWHKKQIVFERYD